MCCFHGDECDCLEKTPLTNLFPLINQEQKGQKKTVTHEFGHALGLAHPTCKDKAIMRQTKDSDYVSYEITGHDEYNICKKYE